VLVSVKKKTFNFGKIVLFDSILAYRTRTGIIVTKSAAKNYLADYVLTARSLFSDKERSRTNLKLLLKILIYRKSFHAFIKSRGLISGCMAAPFTKYFGKISDRHSLRENVVEDSRVEK
jgi:hypothetical protein